MCPNWARTDLCGGREVTRVPTAKVGGTRTLAEGSEPFPIDADDLRATVELRGQAISIC